jgi:hypothetical protein
LVPVIYANELEAVANDFLARHYPEALEKPTPVDTEELARRMGLNIEKAHLSKYAQCLGRFVLKTGLRKYLIPLRRNLCHIK